MVFIMKRLMAIVIITAMFIGFFPIIAVDREPVHNFYMYLDENGQNVVVDLGLSYQSFSIADETKEENVQQNFYNPNSRNRLDVLHLTDYKLTKNSFESSEKNLVSLWLLWNVLNAGTSSVDVSFYYKPASNENVVNAVADSVYPTFSYIYSRTHFSWSYQQQPNGTYYFTIKYNFDSVETGLNQTNLRRDELSYAENYVKNHPVPPEGFSTVEDEKAYVKNVYDHIMDITKYSWKSTNVPSDDGIDQMAYSSYYLGHGVCNSYASAIGIICAYAGINVPYINGDSHAWNMVYPIDGSEYRLLDATWDDGNYPYNLYFWITKNQAQNGSYTLKKHYPDSAMENFIIFLNTTNISSLSGVSGSTTVMTTTTAPVSIKDKLTLAVLIAAIKANLNNEENLTYDINNDGKLNAIDIAIMRRIIISK